MANGHPDAAHYPVHRVWEESELVVERGNQMIASKAMVLQLAVSSAFTGDKNAIKEFNKLIKGLLDGTEG